MRKFLLLSSIFVASTVLAFGGGGGGGRTRHFYERHGGVDAIGIHIDGKDNKPNIDIRTCDSETEELVGTECLPKCADGLERNTDGSCSVCAGENANVYLSYMDDPCGTETPMDPPSCTTDGDCWSGCCNGMINLCMASIFADYGMTRICPNTEAKLCKSNHDCSDGEFCAIYGDGIPKIGSCMPIEIGMEYTWNNTKFLLSQGAMSWWSAENWCKAQGRQMVKLVDLVDTTGLPKTSWGHYECDGADCENIDWDALQNTFGDNSWWTDDMKNSNSAQVMYVGGFYGETRLNDADCAALCK